MNAEQTSDDQALERLLDELARSAVAEIQALERRTATKDKQDSIGEDASEE